MKGIALRARGRGGESAPLFGKSEAFSGRLAIVPGLFRGLIEVAVLSYTAALCAHAQTPTPAAAGVETSWDIAPVIQEIGAQAGRLLPALDQVDVRSWVDQGASETYLEQLDSSRQQARVVQQESQNLARSPERLTSGMALLFRIESLDAMLLSLEQGMRKYQSTRAAEILANVQAQGGPSRDKFERYLMQLAADQEQRLRVMDEEAQRCRAIVIAPKTAGKKK
jgi:hypothetical protein